MSQEQSDIWTLCPRGNVKLQAGRQLNAWCAAPTRATTCFFPLFFSVLLGVAWFGGRAGRWRLAGRRLLAVRPCCTDHRPCRNVAETTGVVVNKTRPGRVAWSGLTPRTTVGVRAQQIQLDAW